MFQYIHERERDMREGKRRWDPKEVCAKEGNEAKHVKVEGYLYRQSEGSCI
jgi:hypothetical protein